jgi:tetratricopeptide (TPR) repeat protein
MTKNKKISFGALSLILLIALLGVIAYKYMHMNSAEYYCGLAANYFNEGKNEIAITNFNSAIEVDPEYGWAYIGSGITFSALNDLDQCISDITRGLNILLKQHEAGYPEFDKAYLTRCEAYYDKEMYDEAIEDYKKSIAINPDFYVPYGMVGMAHQKMGNDVLAISYYDKALAINPMLERLYFLKAKACESSNRIQEAINAYKSFAELAGKDDADKVKDVLERVKYLESQNKNPPAM